MHGLYTGQSLQITDEKLYGKYKVRCHEDIQASGSNLMSAPWGRIRLCPLDRSVMMACSSVGW
jgi:hypothetical protein